MSDSIFIWLVDSTVAAFVLLCLGAIAMIIARQPAMRQRIGEWTLAATLLALMALAIPQVSIVPLGWLGHSQAAVAQPGLSPSTHVDEPNWSRGVDRVASDQLRPNRPEHSNAQTSTELASDIAQHTDVKVNSAQNELTASASAEQPTSLPASQPSPAKSLAMAEGGESNWTAVAVLAYASMAALSLVWTVIGYFGLRRICSNAKAPDAETQARWQQLGGTTAERTRLLVSHGAFQPMTFGICRATVVIPASLCQREARDDLECVLRHELTHVERRDFWSWVLANLARAFLFHQPLFWWIRGSIRLSFEYVADSWAAFSTRSTLAYAEFLTATALRFRHRRRTQTQAVGIFHSRSEIYRRVKMLSQSESVVDKWCSGGKNLASGAVAIVATGLISLFTLGGQTDSAEATPNEDHSAVQSPDEITAETSRISYILEQPNSFYLLHGLPQRIEPFAVQEPGDDVPWQGVDAGGSLELTLDVASKSTGEITLGFFTDARWWIAPPAQVRKFAGPGKYRVSGLPPGTYYIGAMLGSLATDHSFGIEQTWPQGIEVTRDNVATAHVRVSDDFRLFSQVRNLRHFVGDWPEFDPTKMITVRTVTTNGTPVPFCNLNFTGQRMVPPQIGTDMQGYGYRDDIRAEFGLIVSRRLIEPKTMAMQSQQKILAERHDPTTRPNITVVWDDFPAGSGTVTGQVKNNRGEILTEYFLSLQSPPYEYDPSALERSSESFSMRIPVIDPEGRFEVNNLAAGEYSISAFPFDYSTHEYQDEAEKARFTLGDADGQTANVQITLQAKHIRYGRAVFADGQPVSRGSYLMQPDGSFRVSLSDEDLERLNNLDDGTIEVAAYEGQGRTAKRVQWEDLSTNPAEPFVITLEQPTTTEEETGPAGVPDDADAVLRLRQLGAIVQKRVDGTVREVTLMDLSLTESDLAVLQKIPNLEQLDFVRTRVDDSAMAFIKDLPHLRILDLAGTRVTDWGISQLQSSGSLRVLSIRHTAATNDSLAALANLQELEELELAATKITDAGLQHLQSLRNLKELDLTRTAVTDAGLVAIAEMTSLEGLNLLSLSITDQGLRHLAALTNLRTLDLSGQAITDAGVAALAGLTELRSFRASGSSLTDQAVDTIVRFEKLERLYLQRTNITDDGMPKLASLKQLRTLYVESSITDAGIDALKDLPNLEVLGIGGPNITDAGVAKIAELKGITNLFLDDSNITDDCVADLIRLRRLVFLTIKNTKITQEGMQDFYKAYRVGQIQQVFGPDE